MSAGVNGRILAAIRRNLAREPAFMPVSRPGLAHICPRPGSGCVSLENILLARGKYAINGNRIYCLDFTERPSL
ncbi:MAG: hypothetical protein DU429_06190 [Candidatus Tokpelaia sp.]|nr:MAG: hypothetical protein DU429_06190 [Candidatus Tokpelaia sp.]KAA6206577.1 MAG: hypothetical protein DU430_00350 [Candidatus Tokpelaia sp.]KAA6405875.1 hypothetical protein DPQ22_02615 [Candidatus Tokpelaia sp.]